jgi:antitoxin ParD1/3/4
MSYRVGVDERVTVSLPDELLVEARRAVETGQAPSVSAYVADAVSAKQQRQQALDELARVFGGPPPPEVLAAVRRRMRGGHVAPGS